MINVTLDIGGRPYTVACPVGEEAHIAALGQLIDTKLASLPALQQQSEVRTLLFAALLLADELQETRGKTTPAPAAPTPDWTRKVEEAARRIEDLTRNLVLSSTPPLEHGDPSA